jgi:hypothetical protein
MLCLLVVCLCIRMQVTSKFEMVITPQTYGKNRDSKDVRLRCECVV